MLEEDRLRKLVEIAKLYYHLDYSQQEIAKKLGISRPTVSRFLQMAKDEGIVQIKINDPKVNNEAYAQQIKQAFQLKDVVIVTIPQAEDRVVKKYLGEAGAEYLYQIVKDGDTIATTWGTTLFELATRLQNKYVVNVNVVQLNGGLSYSETNTYASEILHLFGKAFNTSPYFLPLPALVDHIVVKQAIEADRHIGKVLQLGREANIAVITVGVPTSDSLLIKTKYFNDEELEIIYSKAVGDICSRYIDINGEICIPELNDRTIGIDLDELRQKEKTILIAGGPKKVEAIYGTLQGKYANTLITDQFTAQALLERHASLGVTSI